jgi:hypothetical protein
MVSFSFISTVFRRYACGREEKRHARDLFVFSGEISFWDGALFGGRGGLLGG